MDIKTEVETGSSLAAAFRKYPLYFDALFCNLVGAGEQAGILESLLDRLATYKEKILAIKSQDQGGAVLPDRDHRGGLRHHRGDHDLRDPGVQGGVHELRRGPAGAHADRDGASRTSSSNTGTSSSASHRRRCTASSRPGSARWRCRSSWTGCCCKLPVFGDLMRKSTIARWTPHALDHVRRRRAAGGGARLGGRRLGQLRVLRWPPSRSSRRSRTGTSLTVAMQNANVFPNMVIQMVSIGEESGALDTMLSQGRRLLRSGGRRRGRGAVLPDGAAHHGGAGRAHRRHGGRHVPADLQAGSGGVATRRSKQRTKQGGVTAALFFCARTGEVARRVRARGMPARQHSEVVPIGARARSAKT